MEYSELEQRLAVGAGAVNRLFKTYLFLLLDREEYLSTADLRELAVFFAGDSAHLVQQDLRAYRGHLHHSYENASLAPFVEQNEIPAWRVRDYEWGIDMQDIGKVFMNIPVKFNLTPDEIFGINQRGGPCNAIKILFKLYENDGCKISDLSRKLEIAESAVSGRLKNFEEAGIACLESFYPNAKGNITYSANGAVIPDGAAFKNKAAQRVLESIKELPKRFSYLDVMEGFGYGDGCYIQSALRELKSQGFIECNCKWVGGVKYSDARLTETGKEFVEFVFPAIALLVGDGHEEYFQTFQGISSLVRGKRDYLKHIGNNAIKIENVPYALALL